MRRVLSAVLVVLVALLSPGQPAAAAPGEIGGTVIPSGASAVLWGGGSMAQLQSAALALGCSLSSAWSFRGGTPTGYVAGAPSFVNSGFESLFPHTDVPAGEILILICAPVPPSTGPEPIPEQTPTATSTATPLPTPMAKAPPGWTSPRVPPEVSAPAYDFVAEFVDSGSPSSLNASGAFVDAVTVLVNGVDVRAPTTPFTFDWGDGSSTTGWFPSSHVYAHPPDSDAARRNSPGLLIEIPHLEGG